LDKLFFKKEGDELQGVAMNCILPSRGRAGGPGAAEREHAGSFQEVMAAIQTLVMPGQPEKDPARETPAQVLSPAGPGEQAVPLGVVTGEAGEALAQEQLSMLQSVNLPADTALSTQAGDNEPGQAMAATGPASEVAEIPGTFLLPGEEAVLATEQPQVANPSPNAGRQETLSAAQKTQESLAGSNFPQLNEQADLQELAVDKTGKVTQWEQMPEDVKSALAGQGQEKLHEGPFTRSSASPAGQVSSSGNEIYIAATAKKLSQGAGGSQVKPEGALQVFNTLIETHAAGTAEKLNQETNGTQVKPEGVLKVFSTLNEAHADITGEKSNQGAGGSQVKPEAALQVFNTTHEAYAATAGKLNQGVSGNQVTPEAVLNVFNTTLKAPAGTATSKEGVVAAQTIAHENQVDSDALPDELMMHNNAILSGANHGIKEKAVSLPEVKNVVMQEIISMVKSGEVGRSKQVELKLEPEHLGQLTIRLFFDRDEVSAHFYTANNQVKELLEGSLQQLRDSLSQYNLKLNEAFVYSGNGNDSQGGRSFDGQEGRAGAAYRQYHKQGYVEEELGHMHQVTETGSGYVTTKIDYLI